MSATYTVTVTGIAPTTTEQHLHDYFAFCGKISSVTTDEKVQPRSAVVHFVKPSAAKTALMLNGGLLDGAHLSVTSDSVHPDEEEHHTQHTDEHIEQSDKPRAGIAAEYLSKGYTLSDQILQRAIELDTQKGISKRFLSYFQSFDTTLGQKALGPDQTISGKVHETFKSAHQSAKSIDEQRGITKTANDYYSKALASPFGQRVRDFYTTTSKQVLDIHEEARRLADQHKPQTQAETQAPTGQAQAAPDAAATEKSTTLA